MGNLHVCVSVDYYKGASPMSQSSVHSPQMKKKKKDRGCSVPVLIQNSLLKKQTHESKETSSPFPLCGARVCYPGEGGWVCSAAIQSAEVVAPSVRHLRVTSLFSVAGTRQVLMSYMHTHTWMHAHLNTCTHMCADIHTHVHTHMITCTPARTHMGLTYDKPAVGILLVCPWNQEMISYFRTFGDSNEKCPQQAQVFDTQ